MGDLEKVLIETSGELGCEPDNEAILVAIQELKQAERERDALAAHVERLNAAINPKILDWIDCGMAANNRHRETWARELRNELHKAIKDAPETSLERLKAQCVADFIGFLIDNCEGSMVAEENLQAQLSAYLGAQAQGGAE